MKKTSRLMLAFLMSGIVLTTYQSLGPNARIWDALTGGVTSAATPDTDIAKKQPESSTMSSKTDGQQKKDFQQKISKQMVKIEEKIKELANQPRTVQFREETFQRFQTQKESIQEGMKTLQAKTGQSWEDVKVQWESLERKSSALLTELQEKMHELTHPEKKEAD